MIVVEQFSPNQPQPSGTTTPITTSSASSGPATSWATCSAPGRARRRRWGATPRRGTTSTTRSTTASPTPPSPRPGSSECFAPDVDGGFTRASAPVVVDVPASDAAQPPGVVYVVPTFGWQRQTETNLKRSVRFGGGLRVYLDRGWFSSGGGELLGVTLDAAAPGDPAWSYDRWKPYVTEWGADPIWQTPSLLSRAPGIFNFPDAVASEEGVLLDSPITKDSPIGRRADVVGLPGRLRRGPPALVRRPHHRRRDPDVLPVRAPGPGPLPAPRASPAPSCRASCWPTSPSWCPGGPPSSRSTRTTRAGCGSPCRASPRPDRCRRWSAPSRRPSPSRHRPPSPSPCSAAATTWPPTSAGRTWAPTSPPSCPRRAPHRCPIWCAGPERWSSPARSPPAASGW